ncbi:SDR family NAD(P)-dependent oxidoreductase [Paraburkholderia rhynchosiae]|uniref:3-oxoacyl-[acyl-carrier-protein] reductase FabG n=1 Tax=Paraburkholderia rhynchosiae TaxID=487049 RepID=A0A2N7W582_9BURK|nr:SDR family oxidoreductase [Paraburkholderia rhynchosiae]PMS24529.1 short-chain dehydrogenase [Paraburkholderia rhynchosiae]CAB3735639.1 3-oxoacyl-[acyl-carrier-protein] reductase FabG [Paraburkholderia rhynchosiae]
MNTLETIATRLANTFGLEGKTAVVTGAASGLGRTTAMLFAELGANVVIADLNLEAAEITAQAIAAQCGSAIAVHADVSDEASVTQLFERISTRFNGVDILVNNAADRSKAEFFDMSVAQWDRMQNVTLRGSFLCSREAIRRMRSSGNGGSIVNVSTVGSVRTTLWGVNAHYDAAKSGVDSLTRTLAGEFAADNIRVNSVLPGGMCTEGGQNISHSFNIRGPMIGQHRIPLGRIADPLEVANAILFLASPASSYVTGQLLAVDGGFMVS